MNYILYNPLANNKTGKEMCIKAIEEIKNEYKDLIEVDLIHSDKEKLMKKFTKNDNVILVGGDGTLNRTANYLYGKPMPYKLFLYKAGTGNDFIRDIIHEKQNQGKLIYLNDYLKKLPKVTINGKVYRFINNVAYGLDGQVCEVADQQKARGKKKINYTSIAINLLLVKYKLVNATITVDGVTNTYKRVWLAPAMNGKYYGGGMEIAPMQDRKDGKITSIVFFGKSRLHCLCVFPNIFKGTLTDHKDMCQVLRGKKIEVTFDKPTAVQIDGETISGVTNYVAEVDY